MKVFAAIAFCVATLLFTSPAEAAILNGINPLPANHHESSFNPINHASSSSFSRFLDKVSDMLTPSHKSSWWDTIVHHHEPSAWEKVFGPHHHTSSWGTFGDRASDFLSRLSDDGIHFQAEPPTMWHSITHSTPWVVLRFFYKLVWFLTSMVFTNGVDIGMFAFDVLAFTVLVQAVRRTMFGPIPKTSSAVYRILRVGDKFVRIIWGPAELLQQHRILRVVLATTVLAPLCIATIFFLVIPAMLFAVMVRNAATVAFGMGLVSLAHATLHRPLSWFVHPVLVHMALYALRFMGGLVMLFSMTNLGNNVRQGIEEFNKDTQAHQYNLRERWNSETDPHDYAVHHTETTTRRRRGGSKY